MIELALVTLCAKAAVQTWNEQEGVDKIVGTDIHIVDYVDDPVLGLLQTVFLKKDSHVYFSIECDKYTGDIHVKVSEYDSLSDKPISESSTLLFEKHVKEEDLL